MGRRSRNERIGLAVPATVIVAVDGAGDAVAPSTSRTREVVAELGTVAGEAVEGLGERAVDLAGRAREVAVELADRAGPYADRALVGARDAAVELADRAGPYADRARDSAVELRSTAGPAVAAAALSAGGALDTARSRSADALTVLRGDRVGPPSSLRRWPWALAAAVAGAAAGALVVSVLRRVAPGDAPGAQEPHELRAVVDTTEPPAGRENAPVTGIPVPSPPVAGTSFEL